MTAVAEEPIVVQEPARSRSLSVGLLSLLAIAALVIAGAAGWLIRGDGGSSTPSASSVDAGFARDMSTHHTQAVTMAGYERDNTTNPSLKLLSFDIETSQQAELGQMSGWLDGWGLSRQSSIPQMAWMGHTDKLESDGLMPGMATPDQMARLRTLRGTPMDILFLQLMIHHHQGGIPMAQYAVDHAKSAYVRWAAQTMVTAQSSDIVAMEQLLRRLGGAPLPPPTA
jgi:uncharacterized protein (DUF305 family)